MGILLIPQNARELWKEWELRLLVLLSLVLQLTLTSQGSRRKTIVRNWIQILVWTTYLLAESMATITLGVLSNRLANIKETKGMIDPNSQIVAFWAPFLLLHLGGPDSVTAYALADNDLWMRQLARLCVQVGLVCYIYSMALSGSTLSILAEGVILVGFIRYAERALCFYLASKGPLRDSMLPLRNVGPIYSRKVDQLTLKKHEGYRVEIEEVAQVPAPENFSVNSSRAREKHGTLVQAHELFKVFKVLFVDLTVHFVDLEASHRIFMGQHMDSVKAFKIVEIELGFMYDLLFTKAPLLNFAWDIIRWVISFSVLAAVLVFFSLQDKKDYPKVDVCITFLLISLAMLLEIYSLLLAISSDWIHYWRTQRPWISSILSAISLLRFSQNQRWSNSVAQFSLLSSSIRKREGIFRHPKFAKWFAKLHMVVEKNFHIGYEKLDDNIKELIFHRMKEIVMHLEGSAPLTRRSVGLGEESALLKAELFGLRGETSNLLKRSNCNHLIWSVEMGFDGCILLWHIATELRHYEDRGSMAVSEDLANHSMSMLISRYMLYLLVFYPSMLPPGLGLLRYEDTLVEAQKFIEDELRIFSNGEGSSISSVLIGWAHKLYKKEAHVHTRFNNCNQPHESRESRDLCEVCWLLLQVGTDFPAWKMQGAESTSVLFDACHLANQLKSVDTWDIISKVWMRLLIFTACHCNGDEHCESLSRGGELLSHVWLLMAHLGIAWPVELPGKPTITKLTIK